MDMLPIYSVPLDQLSIDKHGRLLIERPAFVETVERVREFQIVATKGDTAKGSNEVCTNSSNCAGSSNFECNNTACNPN